MFNFILTLKLLVRVLRGHGWRAAKKYFEVLSSLPDERLVKTDFKSELFSSLGLQPSIGVHEKKLSTSLDASVLDVKAIAFYLPQFHAIPENDLWWGEGFTEWTNVTKATPKYVGHYQPHLPGALGFYDLNRVEVMRKQVEIAKHFGIYGFCFHYYWFSGKRLLETPIFNFLEDLKIDFPFCISWANESWSRRWDGSEKDVLMDQVYSVSNDLQFIKDAAAILSDSRYIRIDGRLLIIVYRVDELPNPAETIRIWRSYCRENELGEIYLVAALSHGIKDPLLYGFDAAVEFPPHNVFSAKIPASLYKKFDSEFSGAVHSYRGLVAGEIALKDYNDFPCYRAVFPSWDNEARKSNKSLSFRGATPELYSAWLSHICDDTLLRAKAGRLSPFVFINAWNEWAEGAHLEPDRKYGYAYLNATSKVLASYVSVRPH